jgi:DNA-binding NtrC family response regulator
MEKLLDYAWPGNVRELENLVKRLVILRAGERILADDIEKILEFARPQGQRVSGELTSLRDIERQYIIRALAKTHGVLGGKKGAAKILGLPRSTLQHRIKMHHIHPEEYLDECL